MATQLKQMKCVACRPDAPSVTEDEARTYGAEIPDWQMVTENGVRKLQRSYRFDNFADALAFTQRVGDLAEEEDHHPTLVTSWGKAKVIWWTHAIRDLHRNDFIMAAKTDQLYGSSSA